jgi:2'-5' RNA ligase
VTVLYPFLPPTSIDPSVENALGDLAARTPRFSYTLSHVARFPGVLFIAPDPPDPFVELTQSICAAWPGHPPYGGAYAQIVPHLTVALGAEPPGLADAIESALPIRATANELSLLCQEHGSGAWLTRRAFRLGS